MVAGVLATDQKKADEEQSTIVWVDEAGFYLLPMAVRTWAPRGQTPLLRVKLTRNHLWAISGITLDGRLFMQVRPASVIVHNLVALGIAPHFQLILPSSKIVIPHFRSILPLKVNAFPHFDDLYQQVNNHTETTPQPS